MMTSFQALTSFIAVLSAQQLYDVELYSMSSEPVISLVNPVGKGHSPCNYTFNPAYVPASDTVKQPGVLLRVAKCPKSYGGTADHIMWAPCDLMTGICGDLQNDIVVPPHSEDPRVVYDTSTKTYYNFYYANNPPVNHDQTTVDYASNNKDPYTASNWNLLNIFAWHRNGCLIIRNKPPHYVIFGESPPLPGLGMAITNNLVNYTVINSTFLAPDASQNEVVIEAGSPPILIPKTGDYFHLYSAGTTGWVANGNYTSGYLILDGNNPNNIIQKSNKHILIPTYPYQIGMGAPYPTQRNRTIFAPTAVNLPNSFANDTNVWDYFRVWFGALDANV
eukprot:344567_1